MWLYEEEEEWVEDREGQGYTEEAGGREGERELENTKMTSAPKTMK